MPKKSLFQIYSLTRVIITMEDNLIYTLKTLNDQRKIIHQVKNKPKSKNNNKMMANEKSENKI